MYGRVCVCVLVFLLCTRVLLLHESFKRKSKGRKQQKKKAKESKGKMVWWQQKMLSTCCEVAVIADICTESSKGRDAMRGKGKTSQTRTPTPSSQELPRACKDEAPLGT